MAALPCPPGGRGHVRRLLMRRPPPSNTLIDILQILNFKVITTASTGIASTLYDNSAGTINSAVGMGIGMQCSDSNIFSIDDFQQLATKIVNSKANKVRFEEGNYEGIVLIIDEISMMGVHNLKLVVSALQRLQANKNNVLKVKRPIQYLLVGNVEQFAPVKDDFFFKDCYLMKNGNLLKEEKSLLEQLRLRTAELTITQRQKDPQFASELNRMAKGDYENLADWFEQSPTIKERFEYSCQNRLPEDATQLFYLRALKNEYNNSKLQRLLEAGIESHTFTAKGYIRAEYEDVYSVKKILEQADIKETITLAVGCIVRVKQNIYRDSNGQQQLYLANGSRGKIVGFIKTKYDCKVKLEMIGTKTTTYKTLGIENLSMPIGYDGIPVGDIEQIPIDLGWASTMHGCQGLTLEENVVIHAYQKNKNYLGDLSYAPSAIYVCISRCVSKDNLYFFVGDSPQDHTRYKKALVRSYSVDKSVNEWVNANYGGTLVSFE